MIFVMIGTTGLCLALLITASQRLLEASLARKVLALRDELRMAAIMDKRVRNSALFPWLDFRLTVTGENLSELSLWRSLFVSIFSRDVREGVRRNRDWYSKAIQCADTDVFARIKKSSDELFAKHLVARHFLITALFLLIGLVLVVLSAAFRLLSREDKHDSSRLASIPSDLVTSLQVSR